MQHDNDSAGHPIMNDSRCCAPPPNRGYPATRYGARAGTAMVPAGHVKEADSDTCTWVLRVGEAVEALARVASLVRVDQLCEDCWCRSGDSNPDTLAGTRP